MLKRGELSSFFKFISAFFLISGFFVLGVFAQEDNLNSTFESAEDVTTIIIVNGETDSSVDAAIAAAISHDIGIPVFYTQYSQIQQSILNELKSGIYENVQEVVILGGEAVVSDEVEESLDIAGVVGGFEVTRIGGVTGTGTAVEAIDYFYGPGTLDGVALVSYDGDGDTTHEDILHLAAQLDQPIIPITDDVEGLPADVVETLGDAGVDDVTVVGDFSNENEIKGDLSELEIKVEQEFNGDVGVIENELQEEVEKTIESGDDVLFVEEGEVPPIIPDSLLIYYKDEDNDGVEDESGLKLDEFCKTFYEDHLENGVKIESINFYSDDSRRLDSIEKELIKENIPFEANNYEDVDDVVYSSIEVNKDNIEEINEDFVDGDLRMQGNFEEHQRDFEEQLPVMIEQFKAFYTNEKDGLSLEELRIGAEIIDEANKGDLVATWKLMHAFANEYRHENYVEECQSLECKQEYIASEQVTLEEKIVDVVGPEVDIAALDAETKIGLLDIVEFYPPTQEDEVKQTLDTLNEDTKAGEIYQAYVDESKEEAYQNYFDELKKEYEALEESEKAVSLTLDEAKEGYNERLILESEAYLAGLINPHDAGIVERAEAYNAMSEIHEKLVSGGVIDTHYLTPEDWKSAYEKHLGEGLTEQDLEHYNVATTAYKTWESGHQGIADDPTGGYYDVKTGHFSCLDPSGKAVTGFYDDKKGTYTYTNENGELVQGDKEGNFHEYNNFIGAPEGWKKNEDGSWSGPGGQKYIPPATGVYDPSQGSFSYQYTDPTTGEMHDYTGPYTPPTGGAWHAPEGWSQSADGAWVSPDGHTYSGDTSSSTGTTWTQNADGTWSAPSGETYSGGSTGGYTGGDTGGHTDSGGGGGESAPSGGDAPSGHVVRETEFTRAWLSQWLNGKR
ncbi:MAG: cell wall-binding repeat-containing protein [Candidatus Aenigmarchaeota archaeon]|nr:cell wall-binding repeat-containing protein [Candidatus Aenigmarchaeota archaeon]